MLMNASAAFSSMNFLILFFLRLTSIAIPAKNARMSRMIGNWKSGSVHGVHVSVKLFRKYAGAVSVSIWQRLRTRERERERERREVQR